MLNSRQRQALVNYLLNPHNQPDNLADSPCAIPEIYTIQTAIDEPFTEIRTGDLYFCQEQRLVYIGEQEIKLTAKEFDILALLITHPKRVFTYELIMELVWNEDYSLYSRKAVNNHVSNLRRKLKTTPSSPDYIKEELRTTPVYPHSAAYAKEHGELEQYRASNHANLQCKESIEAAVREHFDGMYLSHDAAKGVIETYGMERVAMVLANTVQLQDWDGRYSRRNQEWAKAIPNDNPETVRCGYVLNSHPAVLNGFIDLVREEQQRSRTQGEKLQPSRPSVRDKLKQELPAHKPAAPKKREPER